MERRHFLASSIAASAATLATPVFAQTASGHERQYYELRRYHLQAGPQTKQLESYLADALIPALNRLGITPVGAFNLDIGPETPTVFVLLPSSDLATLVTAQLQLARDEQFMKAATPFWSAAATTPAFQRVESSLMAAFAGWPMLTPPAASAQHAKRIFQLRTYESPSDHDHVLKVEMFHHGEFEIFQKSGFGQVFYGDTLIGPRLPNLTYMLTFPDLATLTARWEVFRADPGWKQLSTSPRYSAEQIVSNISNLILSPLDCSQI